MAITVGTVGTNTADPAAGTLDLTVTLDAGADRALIVGLSLEHDGQTDGAITAVTFDPGGGDEATLTQVEEAKQSDIHCVQYGLLETDLPTAGSYTVRATWTSSDASNNARVVAGYINVAGFDEQSFPTNTVTYTSASSSLATMAMTTTGAGALVASIYAGGDDEPVTTYANGTEQWDTRPGVGDVRGVAATEIRVSPGAGAVTFTPEASTIIAAVTAEWPTSAIGVPLTTFSLTTFAPTLSISPSKRKHRVKAATRVRKVRVLK